MSYLPTELAHIIYNEFPKSHFEFIDGRFVLHGGCKMLGYFDDDHVCKVFIVFGNHPQSEKLSKLLRKYYDNPYAIVVVPGYFLTGENGVPYNVHEQENNYE